MICAAYYYHHYHYFPLLGWLTRRDFEKKNSSSIGNNPARSIIDTMMPSSSHRSRVKAEPTLDSILAMRMMEFGPLSAMDG